MNKKIGNIAITWSVVIFSIGILSSSVIANQGSIKRLTYSGNNSVFYPCLSEDGRRMLYVLESGSGDEITRSIRLMDIETGKETVLFKDREANAPEPYDSLPLLVGSKPPTLSGDGRVAAFVLSLDKPENILDHYLAIINSDGTGLEIHSFPIQSLQDKNWKSLGFKGNEWERVSHFALNADGSRVACALKGHMGPIRYGNASAISLLDTRSGEKRTILAPAFTDKGWEWPEHPSKALLGGGWTLSMDAAGDKILFGANSSDDSLDFDLYIYDWTENGTHKVTNFHDRWFSQAELSGSGEKVVLYYTGKKKRGIGTYLVDVGTNESEALLVESEHSPRVEFFDVSGNGKVILHKHIYDGFLIDTDSGAEFVAFDRDTPGYVSALVPMDFPGFPAFWGPHIMNHDGTIILLSGIPEGKNGPEIYLLNLGDKN
jgi:hypothetical protein